MRNISIRVDDEVKDRLDALAALHGIDVSRLLHDALLDRLEEWEDFREVSARLARPHRRLSDAEAQAEADDAD